MNKYILASCFLIGSLCASAQIDLRQFNKERLHITKTSMIVLGAWSAANIITGAIGTGNSSGEAQYFHRMNLIWGSVNLVIAGVSYLSLTRKKSENTFGDTRKAQSAIEKTFLFNAGLDLVYITAGAYFLEKAKNNSNPDKYNGFGKGVIMQGGALLLFDGFMYMLHVQHGKKLWNALDNLQVGAGSVGVRVDL